MQTKPAVLSAQLGRPQWRAPARRRDDSDSEDEEDEEAGASYSIEEYGDSDDFDSDTTMRLYLDTADVAQWTKWAEAGVFYGTWMHSSLPGVAAGACGCSYCPAAT
jgi:hypothetical protein